MAKEVLSMRIDEGMPATLIVGNQELGCFVSSVIGDSLCWDGGARVYGRIESVTVVPWRSPYDSPEEELDAIEGMIDGEGKAIS